MSRDWSFPLLLLCFFLSGLAALVYETAWTREFEFVFGTSNLAVATVLAAYMAGLAGGAALAARFAHRVQRPVLAYGLLELGIAVAALCVPAAISGSRALYVALFGGLADLPGSGGLSDALFFLLCSFAILALPTAMMGATLPLLARHAVHSESQIGPRIGVLYATNTAGAVAGTLLAGFLLVPGLGLRPTIWAAAGINAAVFAAAWGLSRVAPPVASEPSPAVLGPGARAAGRWILPLLFASGVASFTYEVLWTRLLDHLLGGTSYAFATMLASFLAGIALGAALASRLGSTARRAAAGFALAQLAIAALSLAAFAALDFAPALSSGLRGGGSPRLLADAALAMLTLFPAAVAIGATFPLAVRVLARGEADAGPASARAYTANTLGSIAGAVAAGFFLVPALGYAATLTACAALNLALAAAAALVLPPRRPRLAGAAALALLPLALLRIPEPWKILRHSPLGGAEADGEVAYFGVGRAATILLLDRRGKWHLRSNGLPESSIDPPAFWHNSSALARWLTVLPTLARPSLRSLLLVGLGGGVAIEDVPSSVERIEVMELEEEVVAANRAVADRRWRDPLSDPRVRIHVNDARNALLRTTRRFDAIVSQPSHPWSAGASHLYTREFFELARGHLSDGGVFVQWIGLSFVNERLFRTLLATLVDVFANVRVYVPPPGGGALFIASDGPLAIEETAGEALAALPEDYARHALRVPEDVTAALRLDERGARRMAAGMPTNRDAHNLLQAGSALVLSDSLAGPGIVSFDDYEPLDGERLSLTLLERLRPARARRLVEQLPDPVERRVGRALVDLASRRPTRARRLLVEALAEAPRQPHARAALLRLEAERLRNGQDPLALVEPPLDASEAAVVSGWRALGEGAGSLSELEPRLAAVPARHPLAADAAALRVEWRIASGEPARAREALAIADASLPYHERPQHLLLRARADVAAGEPAAALGTLALLGQRLDRRRGFDRTLAARGLRLANAVPEEEGLAGLRGHAQRVLTARSLAR